MKEVYVVNFLLIYKPPYIPPYKSEDTNYIPKLYIRLYELLTIYYRSNTIMSIIIHIPYLGEIKLPISEKDYKKDRDIIDDILKQDFLLRRCRLEYYVFADPTYSDHIYDSLEKKLKELISEYPQYNFTELSINTVGSANWRDYPYMVIWWYAVDKLKRYHIPDDYKKMDRLTIYNLEGVNHTTTVRNIGNDGFSDDVLHPKVKLKSTIKTIKDKPTKKSKDKPKSKSKKK